MSKIVTLDNLAEFKSKCDDAYSGGSGGTQLYRHEITAVNDEGEEPRTDYLVILSTSSDNTASISDLFNNYNGIFVSGYASNGNRFIAHYNNSQFLIVYDQEGSLSLSYLTVIGISTHTVTPL